MTKPTFDIAVVTVSTNKLHAACLQSLKRAMDATDLRVGFVLVDNGSTEYDAYALVTEHIPEAIVLLRQGNHGFGRSCNKGADCVDATYYFFLNPDTRMDDERLFDRLFAFAQQVPRVGIVAPRIRYMDGRVQETCRRFPRWFTPIVQRTGRLFGRRGEQHRGRFLMSDYDHKRTRMVDWVQGSAFMMDAALFWELGGFDERYFMYFEDVDLCRQCWDRGRPVYYLPEAELAHEYARESAGTRLFANRLLRAHMASWLRYVWKWKAHTL